MPLVGSSFRESARVLAETVSSPSHSETARTTMSNRPRGTVLVAAGVLVAALVALEWYSQLSFSLGIFYVFPILLAGLVLTRTQVVMAACALALIRGQFTPGLVAIEYWLRFAMATIAYTGAGLLVVEISERRRRLLRAYRRLQVEKSMRYRAESGLRLLAESSPAAIVTLNEQAEVISANRAAADILGFDSVHDVVGQSLAAHVPIFLRALQKSPGGRPLRTSATSWARRVNGQIFPITVWFSTYGEGTDRRLAGILVDTSEEVRDREREAFRHFLDYNRLLAGAVAHEIRNMCAATRVVAANLSRRMHLHDDVDFKALNSLLEGLSRIAAFELETGKATTVRSVDLHQVFDQLRVVIEPDWTDMEGTISWHLEDTTLHVPADAHAILQVLLNLTQNSFRAVQEVEERRLEIHARRDGNSVVVSVIDSGPGVRDTSLLFQPFREDADGSGLGLYISRAVVRTFGGDLRFVPVDRGCQFDVVLPCEPMEAAVA